MPVPHAACMQACVHEAMCRGQIRTGVQLGLLTRSIQLRHQRCLCLVLRACQQLHKAMTRTLRSLCRVLRACKQLHKAKQRRKLSTGLLQHSKNQQLTACKHFREGSTCASVVQMLAKDAARMQRTLQHNERRRLKAFADLGEQLAVQMVAKLAAKMQCILKHPNKTIIKEEKTATDCIPGSAAPGPPL
eukprot:669362-Pelagomonas_calceolata.AAC.4